MARTTVERWGRYTPMPSWLELALPEAKRRIVHARRCRGWRRRERGLEPLEVRRLPSPALVESAQDPSYDFDAAQSEPDPHETHTDGESPTAWW